MVSPDTGESPVLALWHLHEPNLGCCVLAVSSKWSAAMPVKTQLPACQDLLAPDLRYCVLPISCKWLASTPVFSDWCLASVHLLARVWQTRLCLVSTFLLWLLYPHKSSSSLTCILILLVPALNDDSSQSYNPLATQKKTTRTILHAITPIRIFSSVPLYCS